MNALYINTWLANNCIVIRYVLCVFSKVNILEKKITSPMNFTQMGWSDFGTSKKWWVIKKVRKY